MQENKIIDIPFNDSLDYENILMTVELRKFTSKKFNTVTRFFSVILMGTDFFDLEYF